MGIGTTDFICISDLALNFITFLLDKLARMLA